MRCPYCSHEGPPTVKRQMNTGGWVLFAVLLLCCLPLCWLPWLIDSCFDDVRSCESCGTRWG